MPGRDIPLVHKRILAWYDDHRRALPWRDPSAEPWAVMVSEVMLQQTQVARVLPVYDAWMRRWPRPSALAAEPAGEAVRMWGRLGYPRRALRLHAAAVAVDAEYDGIVPRTYDGLRALPGVGDYTANAVLAFAYRQRAVVLDTNVRRVHGRVFGGVPCPPRAVAAAERRTAAAVLPDEAETAARWSVAVMELGALVCTARSPMCAVCPVADACSWRAAGYPGQAGRVRRGQSYAGTDRQCRGRILGVLRDSDDPVSQESVAAVWDDADQRSRALASLIADGLAVERPDGLLSLPS
ncbi:MAG TPA: A/G-specific adenine glycosylase [Nocardioidaceae bacterium]